MTNFYFTCKRKKVINALKKLDFALKEGKNHTKAKCINNGKQTTIPRHKIIKSEIVNSICKFLVEKKHDKKILEELLG